MACVAFLLATNTYLLLPYLFPGISPGAGDSTYHVPQYFQTVPELWPGPTATGQPAFLAQTRVIDPASTYVPNAPLQTAVPIQGMQDGNRSIFHMMGYLTPYSPSLGFGVDEYPLPEGAEIIQVQMLSRHGSRYPTSGSEVNKLGDKIASASSAFSPSGALSFLKGWSYQLGAEILVPKGREELYESGEFLCLPHPSISTSSLPLSITSTGHIADVFTLRRFAQLHVRTSLQSKQQDHRSDNSKFLTSSPR